MGCSTCGQKYPHLRKPAQPSQNNSPDVLRPVKERAIRGVIKKPPTQPAQVPADKQP